MQDTVALVQTQSRYQVRHVPRQKNKSAQCVELDEN